MKRILNRISTCAVVAATLLSLGTAGAFAETAWEHNHPRRDQVNDRLAHQNARIRHEVREGELTRGQAARLHRADRAIRGEERTMARFNNGHITPAEQRALNQQENAVSGRIGH